MKQSLTQQKPVHESQYSPDPAASGKERVIILLLSSMLYTEVLRSVASQEWKPGLVPSALITLVHQALLREG